MNYTTLYQSMDLTNDLLEQEIFEVSIYNLQSRT